MRFDVNRPSIVSRKKKPTTAIGNDDVDDIPCFGIHLKFEQTFEQLSDFAIEYCNGTQYCCGMYSHCELKIAFSFDAEKVVGQFEVTAAADREEFGESLQYTHDYGFQNTHFVLGLFVVFKAFHDGENFHGET